MAKNQQPSSHSSSPLLLHSSSSSFSSSSPANSIHLTLFTLLVLIVGCCQCWPVDSMNGQGVFLLKKSDAPQWEDLGWAWGKKRAAPAPASPQWDDLGWSWGKRSAADGTSDGVAGMKAVAAEELIEKAADQLKQQRSGGRNAPIQASSSTGSRVMRSAAVAAKNPDWHDLGWAWGRRR